jgi:HPt (histidine-containing phosphotransfer) domain-containing protein
MDDFIIKPAKLEDLKRVLAKWLPHEKSKNKALEFVEDSKKDDVLDTSMLIEMIGDNKDSHCFLLKSFLSSTPDIIEDLKKAYDARLQENITDQAHKLKSSARSIGAHQLADFCEELQHAGENGQWQVIDQQFPHLDNLFEELRDAANDYCKVEWSNQE